MSRVIPVQTVTTTASKIHAGKGGSVESPNRVIIQNNSSDVALYINIVPGGTTGGTATADATHFPIPFGGSIEIELVSPEDIWAVSGGSCPVSVIARY